MQHQFTPISCERTMVVLQNVGYGHASIQSGTSADKAWACSAMPLIMQTGMCSAVCTSLRHVGCWDALALDFALPHMMWTRRQAGADGGEAASGADVDIQSRLAPRVRPAYC